MTEAGGGDRRLAILLAMAMFVLVVDTSLMNVSISSVVEDLDTTVSGVQSANALEALVSAAFILVGGKVGDLIGRKRAYVLGLLGYAVGAGIWIVQRVAEAWLDAAGHRTDAKTAVGLKFASMVGRTWLVAIAILAVGLTAEREDGFTAAVVCLAAYTVHLATALILRPLERNTATS